MENNDRSPTIVEALLIMFMLLLFTPMGWVAMMILWGMFHGGK